MWWEAIYRSRLSTEEAIYLYAVRVGLISVYRLESGLKGTFTALVRTRGNTSGVGTWEVLECKRCLRCGFSRCALRCALRMQNARTARALWKDGRYTAG